MGIHLLLNEGGDLAHRTRDRFSDLGICERRVDSAKTVAELVAK